MTKSKFPIFEKQENKTHNNDWNVIDYNNKILPQHLEICKPLFDKNISVFEYNCYFEDGTGIYLSTDPEWHRYYLQNYARSLLMREHIQKMCAYKTKYHIWDTSPGYPKSEPLKVYIKDRRNFNMKYDFTIYLHYPGSIKSFNFSTTEDHPQLLIYCVNNIPALMIFIDEFEKYLSNIYREMGMQKLTITTILPFLKNNFDPKIKGFRLDTPKGIVELTPREIHCLSYLSKGKSYKEIAELMRVDLNRDKFSPRTVESYVKSIKDKAQGLGLSQLIDLFLNSPLCNILFSELL